MNQDHLLSDECAHVCIGNGVYTGHHRVPALSRQDYGDRHSNSNSSRHDYGEHKDAGVACAAGR